MKLTPEKMAQRVFDLSDERLGGIASILRQREKLARIFKALQMGYKTKQRVAAFAGISRMTINRILIGKTKADKKFQKYYDYCLSRPIARCLKSINAGISEDPKLALSFIERLAPEYTKEQKIKVKSERKNVYEITVNNYQKLPPRERQKLLEETAKECGMEVITLEKDSNGVFESPTADEGAAGCGAERTQTK